MTATYTNDETFLDQSRQLTHTAVRVLAGATTPEHARLIVCSHVDGLEGNAIGPKDGLEPGGGCHDVRRAGRQGSVDVEGRIGLELSQR